MSMKKEETPFRIGGVYWNRHRDTTIRLGDSGVPDRALMVTDSGIPLWVQARLSDGFSINPETGADWGEDDGLNLLPGELHQINGQWVPVEDKPASDGERFTGLDDTHDALDLVFGGGEPIGDDYDEGDLADAAMIARDGPAKVKPVELRVCERTGSTCRCYCPQGACAMKPTTKPSPFARFRSPDLIASTHQADPQHQLKG